MDEDIEAILRQLEEEEAQLNGYINKENEWQTVSYRKRNRNRTNSSSKQPLIDNSIGDPYSDVFNSVDDTAESSGWTLDDEVENHAGIKAAVVQVSDVSEKKEKEKKKKKIKKKKSNLTVEEAASRINADDLGAFLAEITGSYESQEDVQLLRFADYFGRAFSSVGGAQFPWVKTFKESTVATIVDIPLKHISEEVYKVSTNWIGSRSSEALKSFVLWALDSSLADLASHQGTIKGSEKVVHQSSLQSQVAIFVVLAMVLRRKPDVMISVLPMMKESKKFQGQDKLPVTVWMIAQVSQGDLVVGLYLWVSLLLPMLSGNGKSGCNQQSRELILQLVERIIASPKANPILLNGAAKKGERVVPPSALDSLLRISFPLPSSRVKATGRLEAVYQILKEVALKVSPGSKATKHLAQQILSFAIKAAGEGNLDLSKEAAEIFIWCLTQNPECYKQWDSLYMDNLEASIVVLRKLSDSDEWKHIVKHDTLDPLRETIKSFSQKNAKALAKVDGARHALLKEADNHCKVILGSLSQGQGFVKSMALASAVLAVGAVFLIQKMDFWDNDHKLSQMLNFSIYNLF